jgi:nucleotide-binding universal stress UspA family protein
MHERILLATDGSSDADAALDHAVELATASDATLHIVSVVETRTAYDNAIIDPEEVKKNLTADATDAVERAETVASKAGLTCETTVVEGPPPEQILALIEDAGADAVVVGATGRSGFKRLILGGTAEQLLDASPVPVIVVGGGV